MKREEFLEKTWIRYPEAQPGWLDVASFRAGGSRDRRPATSSASASKVTLAGRLMIATQLIDPTQLVFALDSGGEEIVLSAETDLVWLAPQSGVVPLEVFEDGDLVAVEGLKDAAGTFRFSGILLLAPQIVPSGQPTLSFTAGEFGVSRSREWAKYVRAIRQFFDDRGFHEALTPTLVPSPGTEPFLDPFSTEWEIGSAKQTLYLPTSPEFHLKQMLSRGWTKIFEMKTCFRNGEIGEHHQPEFLMLEWYRAYAGLNAIADDVEQLLAAVAEAFDKKVPPLKRTTMPELFDHAFDGFTLAPTTSREELAELAARHQVAVAADDSFDDIFFRLFLEKIERGLGVGGPVLVSHYPPSQAALSRIGAHGFAERFEVYWEGLELANAFHELNDPKENEARFADDASKKKALGKPAVPRDENLVRALREGMPPSGGIALGVDRLFMALMGIREIAETRAFPLRR